MSPIAVYGQGTILSEECLLYRDLYVRNCKFLNTVQSNFVYVQSAQKVYIENNVFERADFVTHENPSKILEANTAMDIIFKGNKYPTDAPITDRVHATNYKNIVIEDEVLNGDAE